MTCWTKRNVSVQVLILLPVLTTLLMFLFQNPIAADESGKLLTLKDTKTEVSVNQHGELVTLKNRATGHNYAGSAPLWRLYFDAADGRLENEVSTDLNQPVVSQKKNSITLHYKQLNWKKQKLAFELELTITLKDGAVRFASRLKNSEPHRIVRELQYPLIGNSLLPPDSKLLTTITGGRLIANPVRYIVDTGNFRDYAGPYQYFRQTSERYPGSTAANCFALIAPKEGLYLGSHDPTFQDTIHGQRVYRDAKGEFTSLEVGLYKYPNCVCGKEWKCNANIIVPYSGDWHQTSRIYRRWVDTWWSQRNIPEWVQLMKGWQRIIFRHQHGATLFTVSDLNGRVKRIGDDVGLHSLMAFGWWDSGMDNGYPDSYFVTDKEQGGDDAWKKAIAQFQKDGGRFLMYFNGKLIDRMSPYYKTGDGAKVCFRDNTGGEHLEAYRFQGFGTFTGIHNSRSFVVADTRDTRWHKMLRKMVDRALEFKADSVFFDQLGYAERGTNWDVSGEFPIPNTYVIADKAKVLKMLHDYLDTKGCPDVAIGTEHFTDVVAQYVDYVHPISGGTGPNDFIDWTRYTFPEVIMTDRRMRDDTDSLRRVNHTLLKGLRNNIEIYRCQDLIDKTPILQKRMREINLVRDKYPDLLLRGTYRDTDGFKNDNPAVEARAFEYKGNLAIVVTQSTLPKAKTTIKVPGKKCREASIIGTGSVKNGTVQLERHAIAVLIYDNVSTRISGSESH